MDEEIGLRILCTTLIASGMQQIAHEEDWTYEQVAEFAAKQADAVIQHIRNHPEET